MHQSDSNKRLGDKEGSRFLECGARHKGPQGRGCSVGRTQRRNALGLPLGVSTLLSLSAPSSPRVLPSHQRQDQAASQPDNLACGIPYLSHLSSWLVSRKYLPGLTSLAVTQLKFSGVVLLGEWRVWWSQFSQQTCFYVPIKSFSMLGPFSVPQN